MFILPADEEITLPLLQEFLDKHRAEVENRYKKLRDAYESRHDILFADKKPEYKPDNRIVVNFPKYITDTFEGFFVGNPIKTTADDESIADFIEYIEQYNDQDDNNAELSKLCSIFGNGFETYFVDNNAELCITYMSPEESFMIYDDSIVADSLYYVRRYKDRQNTEYGCVYSRSAYRDFKITGGLQWITEWIPHYFDGVPAVEYMQNEERIGAFEPVLSMVNSYNKAISEKANDVDYFADAYLKVLGAEMDENDVKHIRNNRVINFVSDGTEKPDVDFMGKPESDTTQENLLNRLERLIFQTAMVANISDENFGTASGIALKYKLLAMNNLAKTKERKFTSGMNRRYKLLFSHPASKVPADSWVQLHYKFTPNIPANLLEEAQIAAQMEGIVSKETQLTVISAVDNVQNELDKIEAENKATESNVIERMMFPDANTAAGVADGTI